MTLALGPVKTFDIFDSGTVGRWGFISTFGGCFAGRSTGTLVPANSKSCNPAPAGLKCNWIK